MQVKFSKAVSAHEIREVLASIDFAQNQIQQFGASQNNEMLIRVQRMAALQPKDVDHITALINQNFANKQARVLFEDKSGNQLLVWLSDTFLPGLKTVNTLHLWRIQEKVTNNFHFLSA